MQIKFPFAEPERNPRPELRNERPLAREVRPTLYPIPPFIAAVGAPSWSRKGDAHVLVSIRPMSWTTSPGNNRPMPASLIGRSGSSAFRLSTHYSVDVAHGLVLLYGIGTKAVPSWDSKTGWNNLSGGLVVSVTTGPSGSTISPHPSSREGHHSTARWSSSSGDNPLNSILLRTFQWPGRRQWLGDARSGWEVIDAGEGKLVSMKAD